MDEASEIIELGAQELAQSIAARRVSATEAVRAMIGWIERCNPRLNAVCTLVADGALVLAAECDRRVAAGKPLRPLEGVPFVVKDNLSTRGVRTTYGAVPFERHVPEEDAICVERLRASGAIMLGKTNTPEFASDVNTTNRLFGPTRNPWDPVSSPGGSSGGTGSALAARMAPMGLGTDLGGSVRVPASFCGVVALRTAPGRIPVYPADFAWDTLVEHVHGPMARKVADLGLMLGVLAGPDDRAPNSLPAEPHDYQRAASGETSIAGRRFAYTADLGGTAPVDSEVAQLTEAAASLFVTLGAVVEAESPDVSDLRAIIAGTRAFGMVGRFADYLDRDRERMSEQLVRQAEDALAVDLRTVAAAERLRSTYYHRMRRFLERHDYILCPTVGVPPYRLDAPLPQQIGGRRIERFYDVFLYTYAFSITGLPVVSVPCGFTRAGLPVGLQIVGRRLREDSVLEAAAAFERAAPQHLRAPRLDDARLARFEPLPSPVRTAANWMGSTDRSVK